MSKPEYVFPGVFPFIEKIAQDTGRDLHQLGRSRQLWHVAQVQDALGQLPGLDPADRQASLENINLIRDSLSLALEGVDAAIADVVANCDLKPVPARREAKKG